MDNDGRGDGQGDSSGAAASHLSLPAEYGGGKFSFATGFEDDLPTGQACSSDAPAKQRERLLYVKKEEADISPYLSMSHSQLNSSISFLDDKFSSSLLDGRQSVTDGSRNSISNNQHWGSFSNGAQNGPDTGQQSASFKNDELDLFFRRNDDALSSLADDLSSSFGSSLHSDLLASSYDSFQYQPQSLNGPSAGQTLSAHFSPPVRSPSSSVRAGSHLSASLRNGSAGTPGLMGTPRTRHASLSGNYYPDGYLSASVPKNLTADERLKRKREFHNAVERRRRELIKQKIKELGTIVPPSLLNYDMSGKQVKPNKGIILNKTVEYLEYLLQVVEIQERRKKQLLNKMKELEEKKERLASSQLAEQNRGSANNTTERPASHEPASLTKSVAQSDFTDIDVDVSNERIIDTRAKPHPHNFGVSQPWGESNSFGLMDNILSNSEHNLPLHDDLQQFLSGDLIEAEDNAKLMFNSGDRAEYLLDFDS
ncbi:hypothetical protein HG536_0B04220 [Torulaspora globosa]|uniref:BHLH domain-containing protein n=1 Tax=Torulaspora globosa TaxID=48254 RepID=A0A7G3ZDH2_9SACH|nr:uncharacterized protein HG536_0B04220 [Torulaspora globosa]QLL31558.1 hypothetical protein HG536_0B04220 [Torulaspora globosa]